MKSSLSLLSLLGAALPLIGAVTAQETNLPSTTKHPATLTRALASKITRWNVKLPDPLPPGTPTPAKPKPTPIDFQVLSSRTTRQWISRAAEFAELPPVQGHINVTIQEVAGLGLPPPKPKTSSTTPLQPLDPQRQAQLAEYFAQNPPLFFISATTYLDEPGQEGPRSLIKIYPSGQYEEQVIAWSNIDVRFLRFHGRFDITNPDGSNTSLSYMIFATPGPSAQLRAVASQHGKEIKAPNIPDFSTTTTNIPTFFVLQGTPGTPAMNALEQIHALFTTSGPQLEQQYHARPAAREARKQYLLTHPGQPQDVTIRFWRIEPTEENPNQGR